jgi:DNA repair ATPase RecN
MPVWKKGATAEERLQELAQIARKHPEQFSNFVIVYQEFNEEEETSLERVVTHNTNLTESLGLLRLAEYRLLGSDDE